NVNVFHGRVQNGRVRVGSLEMDADLSHPDGLPVKAYVRPHELHIDHKPNGKAHVAAKVAHVNPAGAVIRVQLVTEDFEMPINVELTPARHAELQLRPGETVYVYPQRVRIFDSTADAAMEDYAI